jgi:basic membrane protein A
LTSVVKGVDTSVAGVIKDVAKGKFTSAGYLGTLANKGTYLASYHSLAKKVPGALQNEVRKLGINIKLGKVKVS